MSIQKFRCPPHWTLRQRLEHYSIPDANTGCILWVGRSTINGYGMLNWQQQPWLAHRLAWSEVHGRIPSAMNVLHRCDVRTCINPDHLFLGTTSDNMRDRREKERIRARLTNGALDAIRSASGSPRELAARYGVPEGLVCRIKHEQLAAELKLPRPPIRVSKSDKLLATMEQLQATLQDVLKALSP
jgi:HNH endonuclease